MGKSGPKRDVYGRLKSLGYDVYKQRRFSNPKFDLGDEVEVRGYDKLWKIVHIDRNFDSLDVEYGLEQTIRTPDDPNSHKIFLGVTDEGLLRKPPAGMDTRNVDIDKLTEKVTWSMDVSSTDYFTQMWGYHQFVSPAQQVAPTGAPVSMPKPRKKAKPKSKPTVAFDSVILEDHKKQSIEEALAQRKYHKKIFDTWGFAKTMEKGKATSLLFHGEPGGGKTLMAQAIADKVGQPLQIIGTAEIESSEPGGVERALQEFFAITDKVLLFDECDSLIYDRTHVGSILGAQVNKLLTCLENYEGIVIFTTNRLGVLDEALNRRISLKVHFSMPTAEQRVLIWKRMFPKKCPLAEDVNWEELATFPITGGYIKNTVLRAARRAAFQKMKAIDRAVLLWALQQELKAKFEFEEARERLPLVTSVSLDKTLRKE